MRDGPRGFRQDSSCPALLRWPAAQARFPVPDCHCLWCDFPDTSGSLTLACASSYYPIRAVTRVVWALSLSLATTQEIDAFFLFLQVLRCFSSLRWLEPCGSWMAFSHPGCPIRMSADQSLFAAPRSFSQLTTSFLAVRSLGILRSLFFASFFFSYSLLSTLISNFFLSEPFQTFVFHVSLKLQSLIFLLQT